MADKEKRFGKSSAIPYEEASKFFEKRTSQKNDLPKTEARTKLSRPLMHEEVVQDTPPAKLIPNTDIESFNHSPFPQWNRPDSYEKAVKNLENLLEGGLTLDEAKVLIKNGNLDYIKEHHELYAQAHQIASHNAGFEDYSTMISHEKHMQIHQDIANKADKPSHYLEDGHISKQEAKKIGELAQELLLMIQEKEVSDKYPTPETKEEIQNRPLWSNVTESTGPMLVGTNLPPTKPKGRS